MGHTNQHLDAERVKENADIVQVVGSYVKLDKAGPGELVGLCPFHKEKTGSFTVTPAKQLWHCFGCAEGGDVFEFVKRIESLSNFGDAVKRVAEISGTDPEFLKADAPAPTRSNGTAAKQPQGKIVATYPYTDEHGEILYEVCRLDPKSFRQRRPDGQGGYTWDMAGVRRVLYRLPAVLQADTVYVVEGEKDVHTLEAAGLVATTNSGGAGQKWQADWTQALADRRVIVLPDNDDPGKKRAAVIQRELAGKAAEVLTVEVPKGKDVTEWFEAGGNVTALEDLVLVARRRLKGDEIERRGLLSPSEILEWADGGINAFLDPSSRAPGLPTGFSVLDDMTLGLHGGELFILAARPSMGKTAMAMNIAAHVAERGAGVAVFSLEMSRESILGRMLCSRARVDHLDYRAGRLNKDERRKTSQALHELCEMPIFIDDRPGAGLKSIRAKLDIFRRTRKLGLVVIDYLQLMESASKENRNQEVGALSRGLKIMAREMNVPFLVLSQLSRAPEGRQGNHRPQLSDLRDSGGIEQDGDVVAFIFREEVYKRDQPELRGLAELILAKQRNGPVGTVRLVFLHQYTKFENRAEEYGNSDSE